MYVMRLSKRISQQAFRTAEQPGHAQLCPCRASLIRVDLKTHRIF